eukprot:scaffold134362_cov37-Prasinocladus_malaysianus.AAC.2
MILCLCGLPNNGREAWGLPLVVTVAAAICVLLVWCGVVRDKPSGFGDVMEMPGFGLVILAKDLAAAIEKDLAQEDRSKG